LLTAEGANYLIRKTDRDGQVTVFAGNGSASSAPLLDGMPAREVSLTSTALATAPNGDVLAIAGHGVVRIDNANTIHTLTQLGEGFSGDGGPAKDAKFLQPTDLAVDSRGNIYIADTNNNRVRRIDAQTAIITTFAGSGPSNGIEDAARSFAVMAARHRPASTRRSV
jgi:DNA-binding beta-propeller fold protein YncE